MSGQRYQIDWSEYKVVSMPCVHENGWCVRPESLYHTRVYPETAECFGTEDAALRCLVSHAEQKFAAAERELADRRKNLAAARRQLSAFEKRKVRES